jgi:hypothetical protein
MQNQIMPVKKIGGNAFGKKIFGSKLIANIVNYVNNNVQAMNQSKIFAGLMIIILNIASKFIIIQLPKTVESYLKFTFSRDLLVFAIAWMGTRDIYIALGIVFIFIFIVDFLCNEKSGLCILPETFVDTHVEKLDEINNSITPQDIQNIKNLAKKIEKDFENTIEEKKSEEKKSEENVNELSIQNPNMGFTTK